MMSSDTKREGIKMMSKLDALKKKLADARNMYEINGMECEGCARAGAYIQLKNAQRRSLGLLNQIGRLEAQIQVIEQDA
jgi:hypothetical protein